MADVLLNYSNFAQHAILTLVPPKGQRNSKLFFKDNVSSKKRMNEFNFTTKIPQVDLFSFVFWRKLMTQKSYFEIN